MISSVKIQATMLKGFNQLQHNSQRCQVTTNWQH